MPVDWFQAGHLMLQDTLDLGKFGYSIYQDQRDNNFKNKVFDYQKAVQQQIFDREDTALQRRMADAEKAGLNPFSVANGSGAGAGAVVGTSGASYSRNIESPNLLGNYGAYLDALNAIERNKQMKTETEILENERASSVVERLRQQRQNQIEEVQNWLDKGINPDQIWYNLDHDSYGYTTDPNPIFDGKNDIPLTSTPLWKRYSWALQNEKNTKDSIEYQSFSDFYNMQQNKYNYDWMNFDRNYQRILRGVEGVSDILHGGSHAVEAVNSFRDVSGRNRLRESQIETNNYRNQPTRTTKERSYHKGGYTERSYSTK